MDMEEHNLLTIEAMQVQAYKDAFSKEAKERFHAYTSSSLLGIHNRLVHMCEALDEYVVHQSEETRRLIASAHTTAALIINVLDERKIQ